MVFLRVELFDHLWRYSALVHTAVAAGLQQQAAASGEAVEGDSLDMSTDALRRRREATNAIVRVASPPVTRSRTIKNGNHSAQARGTVGSEPVPGRRLWRATVLH